MIYDAARLDVPARLHADVCVVGSGPGGAAAASVLARAGLHVVVLEAGAFVPPSAMTRRERDMLPQLYWEAATRTTADGRIQVHQGRGVGGSSLHNLNLCKRIPESIRRAWAARGLGELPPARWDALYDEVEERIGVSEIAAPWRNPLNRLLERATSALGWRGGPLRHNRTGCVGAGTCELGCAYDAKNNALKVFLVDALRHDATVLAHCAATAVRHRGGEVNGVDAVALDVRGEPRGRIAVESRAVVLAASATASAAIVVRSELPLTGVGRTLRLHPGVFAAGLFDEPVHAWRGIPQSWECTEWLDVEGGREGHRCWVLPAFAHPMGFAAMVPGFGRQHWALARHYAHLAAFSAMLHDETAGRIEPDGDLGLRIHYEPSAEDRAELAFGLARCAEALFAAGATRVWIPSDPPMELTPSASLAAVEALDVFDAHVPVAAVHPMGTLPLADDPHAGAVHSSGRVHGTHGLWVADGSLFASSIGVPPQLSIYAMGLHVGEHVARALTARGG